MPPTYKLVYFNGRGRAEINRLLFASAGVEYEDVRAAEDWTTKYKAASPTGQAPYLYVDDVIIAQSLAIARYLAREFGCYGSGSLEAGKIDMIVDSVDELGVTYGRVCFAEGEVKAKLEKQFVDKIPSVLNMLETYIKANGGGHVVGSKVSLADLAIMHYMSDMMVGPAAELGKAVKEGVDKHPNVAQLIDKVANLPNIKQWIEKRPKTEW